MNERITKVLNEIDRLIDEYSEAFGPDRPDFYLIQGDDAQVRLIAECLSFLGALSLTKRAMLEDARRDAPPSSSAVPRRSSTGKTMH